MKLSHLHLAPGLALLLLPTTLPANAPPSVQKKAQELVRLLGSDSFQEREQATGQLRQMGLVAKDALEQGTGADDLEVRRRCQDLLPDVLAIDLKNRITAFLADKDGKTDHALPLWQTYRKAAGAEPAARQLFGEMLQGDTIYFLLACDEAPERQAENLERYSRKLQQQLYQPRPGNQPQGIRRGELAAALFVGALVKNGNPQTAYILSSMLYQPVGRLSITDGPQAGPFKGLLVRWMRSQTQEQVLVNLTHMIQNLNFKEGTDFLCEVVREKKVRGVFLAQMAANLGRLGNKDHIPVLTTLLDDKTVLGQIQLNQTAATAEVRDAALSMLVHVTGQAHKDYGFAFLGTQPALMFAPHYCGFRTPEEREKAHKKWQDWTAAQKKK